MKASTLRVGIGKSREVNTWLVMLAGLEYKSCLVWLAVCRMLLTKLRSDEHLVGLQPREPGALALCPGLDEVVRYCPGRWDEEIQRALRLTACSAVGLS